MRKGIKKDWLVQVDNKIARGVLCGVPQSLICERLLFASIGNFNPDGGNMAVEFDISHVMKGNAGSYRKKRIDGLCSKMFGCHISEAVENGEWKTAVFTKMFVNKSTGKVTAMFNNDIMPYIVGLKSEFTMVPLDAYLGLSSRYSAILYRVLKSFSGFKGKVPIKISADDLLEKLGAPERACKDSWWFKAKILEPALKEINAVMDVMVTYTAVKKGRSVDRYDFKIGMKRSVKDQIKARKSNGFYANNPDKARDKKEKEAENKAEEAIMNMEMTGELRNFLGGVSNISLDDCFSSLKD